MTPRPRVALLDWDWTLREGFTLEPWLRALARDPAERALADRFPPALAAYLAGELPYDRLALLAEELYVTIAAGRPVGELVTIADGVAATDRLRPGAEALLSALRTAAIRPVVISGAPAEVLRAHARRVGIDPADVTGWELARDGDRIAGRLASGNTARAEAKAVHVARIAAEAEIVLGIGDSDGDRPLVAAAAIGAWVDPRTADEAARVRWTDARDGSGGQGSLADLARLIAAA